MINLLKRQRWALALCTIISLLGISQAHAAGLSNAGVNLSSKTVPAGGTLTVGSSVYASVALNNVSITYGLYALSATNVPAATPTLTYLYRGQNFDKGEYKAYQVPFNIPRTLTLGRYLLKIFGTNADQTVRYFSMEGVSDKVTVTITAATSPTPTPTPTVTPSPTPSPSPTATATPSYVRGFGLLDLAKGGHLIPGVYGSDYTKPNLVTLKAIKSRGINVIRLPFQWERLQHQLGGPLNTAYLGYIMDSLRDSKTAGIKIILDMHNYARYYNPTNKTYLAFGEVGGPTRAQYQYVWSELVKAIRADANAYDAIYAFDIMNEPHHLPSIDGMTPQRLWEVYAQDAVNAIRATGDKKIIMVGGYFFQNANMFSYYHPVPFITDAANNIMYAAHAYFDNDTSGEYKRTFAEETSLAQSQGHASVAARSVSKIKSFTDWTVKHKVKGFLGEFGWPNSESVGAQDAALWNQSMEAVYAHLDSVKMGAAAWLACSSFAPGDSNVNNIYYLPGQKNSTLTPLSPAVIIEKYVEK